MKANEFVKKFGREKTKIVLEKSPSNAQSYHDGYYFRETPEFLYHNGFHPQWEMTTNNGEWFKKRGFDPVNIDDLKRLVESWELVEKFGGLDKAKKYLIDAEYLGMSDMIFGTPLPTLKQAIADVERCQ